MNNEVLKALSLIVSILNIIPVGIGLYMGIESMFILGFIGIGVFAYININL